MSTPDNGFEWPPIVYNLTFSEFLFVLEMSVVTLLLSTLDGYKLRFLDYMCILIHATEVFCVSEFLSNNTQKHE